MHSCENSHIVIYPDRNLSDLKNADDVVPFNKNPNKQQALLAHPNNVTLRNQKV